MRFCRHCCHLFSADRELYNVRQSIEVPHAELAVCMRRSFMPVALAWDRHARKVGVAAAL